MLPVFNPFHNVHICGLGKVYEHSYLHLKQIKTVCVDLCFKKSFERHISH